MLHRHGLAGRRVVLPDRHTAEDALQVGWLDVWLDCILEGRGLLALSSACLPGEEILLGLPLPYASGKGNRRSCKRLTRAGRRRCG
jgi:hypothetical protein